ncbi:LysR substrate binding domain-containing protein [Haloactinopolyspora alba]|uniref:LysR substrate binding domain-containing protein n=1 Tax=Haloactinopolyspora alba TaxID=648780 RepID=A0A2P8E5I7_9ACTN|nr:LysR substrate binding domain-containing protein [Haloactinopolyspora alba]
MIPDPRLGETVARVQRGQAGVVDSQRGDVEPGPAAEGLPTPRWPDETPTERAYWSGRERTADDVVGPAVSDATQLFEVVALGQAVALVPASLAERHPRSDVALRPVVDASPYTIAIAWPEAARAASTATFVRTACELYEPQVISA